MVFVEFWQRISMVASSRLVAGSACDKLNQETNTSEDRCQHKVSREFSKKNASAERQYSRAELISLGLSIDNSSIRRTIREFVFIKRRCSASAGRTKYEMEKSGKLFGNFKQLTRMNSSPILKYNSKTNNNKLVKLAASNLVPSNVCLEVDSLNKQSCVAAAAAASAMPHNEEDFITEDDEQNSSGYASLGYYEANRAAKRLSKGHLKRQLSLGVQRNKLVNEAVRCSSSNNRDDEEEHIEECQDSFDISSLVSITLLSSFDSFAINCLSNKREELINKSVSTSGKTFEQTYRQQKQNAHQVFNDKTDVRSEQIKFVGANNQFVDKRNTTQTVRHLKRSNTDLSTSFNYSSRWNSSNRNTSKQADKDHQVCSKQGMSIDKADGWPKQVPMLRRQASELSSVARAFKEQVKAVACSSTSNSTIITTKSECKQDDIAKNITDNSDRCVNKVSDIKKKEAQTSKVSGDKKFEVKNDTCSIGETREDIKEKNSRSRIPRLIKRVDISELKNHKQIT